MRNRIILKVAAVIAAVMVNGTILGSVAYLFHGQCVSRGAESSMAQAPHCASLSVFDVA